MKRIVLILILIILKNALIYSQESLNKYEFEIYFIEALKYEIKKDFNNALKIYFEIKKEFKEKDIVDYRICMILFEIGDYANALKFAKDCYNKNKNSFWYGWTLIELLRLNGNFDSAIIVNKEMMKTHNEKDLYLNLIELYLKKKDFISAKRYIRIAKNYFKNDLEIIKKEIEAERSEKKRKILIEKALKMYPNEIFLNYLYAIMQKDTIEKIRKLERLYYENKENNIIKNEYLKIKCKKEKEKSCSLIEEIINNKNLSIDEKIESVKECYDCVKNNDEIKEIVKNYIKEKISSNEIEKISDLIKNEEIYCWVKEMLYEEFSNSKNIKYLNILYDIEKDPEKKLEILEEIGKLNKIDKCLKNFLRINLLYEIKKFNENYEKIYDEIKYLCNDLYKKNKKYLDYIYAEYYRGINEFKKSDSIFYSLIKEYPDDYLIKNNFAYYKALRNEDLENVEKISFETIKKNKNNYHFIDTYAWILYKRGKLMKSKKYIKKAYKLMKEKNENNNEIIEHYNIILKK